MSSGRRVCAARLLAVAFLMCCICVDDDPVWAADSGQRFILFGGGDAWRDGDFIYGGLLYSPGGSSNAGFVFKTFLSGGSYQYWSGGLNSEVVGREAIAEFLPGWRFKRDHFELQVFAGLDLEEHHLAPDDPSSNLRGGDVGLRAAVDLWYEPTPQTMLAANGSISTIITSYSARLAFGWRTLGMFYLGPEIETFACQGYEQFRAGIHLTALKTAWLGGTEWSAAAGWARDDDQRESLYVRLNVLTRR